jgi:hypothetical protein
MHYWNKDFFETLKLAAASAENQAANWQEYVDFCLQSEKGLRSQALVSLNKFIEKIERKPFSERRKFVRWLMRNFQGRESYMLAPHPLKVRIVEPTLLEWTLVEPHDFEPHLWIGDLEHLEKAYELKPANRLVLKKLVIALLGPVQYAGHHLPEGYLGEASKDMETIKRLESLLTLMESDDDRNALARDVAEEKLAIEQYLRGRA